MNRLHKKLIRLAAVVFFGVSLLSCGSDYEYSYLYKGLPFEMEKVHRPYIPPRSINVEDFGAKGDGVTMNTAYFEDAIEVLSQNGGGRLVVSKGLWLTGPLTLKDNIELHLTSDAVLVFAATINEEGYGQAMIKAEGASDVAITGNGIIDGNADAVRPVSRDMVTPAQWRKLIQKGGVTNRKGDMWYPDSTSYRGAVLSPVVYMDNCKNVLIEGCIFRNTPSDAVYTSMSKDLIIDGVSVVNPVCSHGCDGVVFDSCEDMLVMNSSFDGVSDAVCVIAGNVRDGQDAASPSRNLIADNCEVFNAEAGFVIGGVVTGGVQNVSVSDCRFIGTGAGLLFKSSRGSGGMVENIYANDLIMKDTPSASILVDVYRDGASASESVPYDIDYVPTYESTPHLRNIQISGVISNGAARAVYFNGIPEMNIENIVLQNCEMTAEKGVDLRYVSGVVMKNVHITQTDSLGYVLANCKNVVMHNCQDADNDARPSVMQYNSENVVID